MKKASSTKTLPGLNIQWPISELIKTGKKTVETRTYPLPKYLEGTELAVIETPGKNGDFDTRIIGIIRFGKSFKYPNKTAFDRDIASHCVSRASPWYWRDEKPKWGWPIESFQSFGKPLRPPKRRGIIYTKACVISL